MSTPISITSIASISPLGASLKEIGKAYRTSDHHFIQKEFNGNLEWVAPLSEEIRAEVTQLKQSTAHYKMLDDSVLFAIYAARKAIIDADWQSENDFGINIGSSRGATTLFEKYHEDFITHKKAATLASPTTTLGNISSWVAHDLNSRGPEISHSITCSTALHSLLNGVAWLRSGMAERFLVGGSEAPLTPFTLAQMRALKIYSSVPSAPFNDQDIEVGERSQSYPCRALDFSKTQNAMVLGEAASMACLEKGVSEKTLAVVEGLGYATEILEHNVSISTDAKCFQRSMAMALGKLRPEEIDVVVMHAPGTVKGDRSEFTAIQKVFCNKIPFLTTNKWKVGHTFGASGLLSIEMAILMLQQQEVIKVPYTDEFQTPSKIKKVMVNAVGFGGNAVSVLLSI
ncbi:MAG: beta-ketoacyl synthase N-terminal-like domain-containing protein [Maribacter sp.]